MDKIRKALEKLTKKERRIVKEILVAIEKGERTGIDIKKLKTRKTVFRIRKGEVRIIYQQKGDKINIIAIERRSDTTYKNM
jgi:mRNA-degrading endonuclease RelE of RelBE toxin-antitoxin system